MDAARNLTIPADLAGCQALIEQLACTLDSQHHTIEELRRDKQELKLAFVELLQRAFRRRSERYINDPNQLQLDLNGTDDAADAAEGPGSGGGRVRSAGQSARAAAAGA